MDIHQFTNKERIDSHEVFLEYGPIPRLCIDLIRRPSRLDVHRDNVTREIGRLNLDSLLNYVELGQGLDMGLSHSIILVKRTSLDNLLKRTIEPLSLPINRRIKQQLMAKERVERLRIYLRYDRVQESSIVKGLIFESLMQLQLQEEAQLDLLPMIKVPGQRGGNAKWISQRASDASSSDASSSGSPPPIHLSFKPDYTTEYKGSYPRDIDQRVFYVPSNPAQVALDSFILIGGVLYIFQMTIAPSHPIKEGIMEFLSHPTLQEADWYFVFIVPSGLSIVCREANVAKMKLFWDNASLFTVEIDVPKLSQPQDGDSSDSKNDSNEPNQPQLPPGSHQIRTSTRIAGQKRKAEVKPPVASTSNVRPPRHKVSKARGSGL